jgi:hypothetical protein
MKSRAVGAVPVALVTRWLRREEETAPWPTTGAVNWSGVVAFVLLAFGLGWAAWIGLRGLCPLALRTYIAAFAPMFAAIAVLRVQRRGSLRRDRRVGLKRVIESIPDSIVGICLVGAAVAAGVGLSLLTGTLALRVGVGQDLDVGFLPEHRHESLGYEGMVVNYEDPDHGSACLRLHQLGLPLRQLGQLLDWPGHCEVVSLA